MGDCGGFPLHPWGEAGLDSRAWLSEQQEETDAQIAAARQKLKALVFPELKQSDGQVCVAGGLCIHTLWYTLVVGQDNEP